jgi:hypothetical protein
VSELIRIQPARHLRVPFARWAVAQEPKLRTISPEAFAVPAHVFTDMPEELLRGSLVNGHPYVSPLDHEETEAAPVGAPELLGVATEDGLREAAPGQPLPEVPATAYGPDSVPLPVEYAPLEEAPAGEEEFVLVGDMGPETVVPLGDTAGDGLARGEDTEGTTPAVTSEDTAGDTRDNSGDNAGNSDRSDSTSEDGSPVGRYPCGDCPRTFKSDRGRDSHRRQVHGKD